MSLKVRNPRTGAFDYEITPPAAADLDTVAARLRTLLPERLPPGLRRSFIQTDDDGYGVSYSSLDGRVRLSIMPFGRERLQAIRDHLQGDGSMREETRSGRTLYVKDEDSRATAAVLLDGAYVRLTAHPDAQLLDAALQALDLSAVEALLAEAAE